MQKTSVKDSRQNYLFIKRTEQFNQGIATEMILVLRKIKDKKDMENFEKNIFINCPFDNDYYPLLRPVLFTVLYHGHIPRIATESFDSGNLRIEKIKVLINSSKYSIHDLSRIEAKKKGDIYRLNMPFELGLDFGCKCFSNPDNKQTEKRILIIE
ncbi:hypothetical protein Barb4_02677 [Bacteroidales bacterium Barb4]|nr:hypothetical protein Barb4_02677 [Bacteroidales bacterium Barb4]